jgi:hypothetical protein
MQLQAGAIAPLNTISRESCQLPEKEFTEGEIVDLTYAVMAINAWNRMAIAMRAVSGAYQPAQEQSSATTKPLGKMRLRQRRDRRSRVEGQQ